MNTEPVYCQTYTEVEAPVRTAKDEIRSMLDALPDSASFEDVQYSIYVRERIIEITDVCPVHQVF